jgi:predicted ATP-grasp superfamily ATP-dependent carboligase
MNILITSSRMPFALDEIRKFGRAGHRVYAADTFSAAPGSHSRYVTDHFEVAAPEHGPLRYLADIERIVRRAAIELIVPAFEEVFYLSRHRHRLPWRTHLFAAGFELLAQLHHKATFHALARALALPTPTTELVSDGDELLAAIARIPRYLARPAWSRGGVEVCTNAGPLAFVLLLRDCHPTPTRPWIVQEYVDGVDLCSFSVAQHGRVVAHCAYVHPKEIEHAGGIVFESVDDEEVLSCVRRVVEWTGYHGQISMDFRRGPTGLRVLECNPRPTAGVHLMPTPLLVEAVLEERRDGVAVVPPGVRRLYASALVRDALLHPRELPLDMAYLLSDADDIYAERGDWLPALYQLLSYGHVLSYRLHHHEPARPATKLMSAYFDGISWNGQPI